jgi:hypothetical protein
VSKSQLRNSALKYAPVFAFLAYGSWATWVNYQSQAHDFISAGIIQGSYAFISTLLLEKSALKIFRLVKSKKHAKFITYLACITLMIGLPALIHYFNHTEEIFYSVLPGAIIGSVYLYLLLRYNTHSSNSRSQHVKTAKPS